MTVVCLESAEAGAEERAEEQVDRGQTLAEALEKRQRRENRRWPIDTQPESKYGINCMIKRAPWERIPRNGSWEGTLW